MLKPSIVILWNKRILNSIIFYLKILEIVSKKALFFHFLRWGRKDSTDLNLVKSRAIPATEKRHLTHKAASIEVPSMRCLHPIGLVDANKVGGKLMGLHIKFPLGQDDSGSALRAWTAGHCQVWTFRWGGCQSPWRGLSTCFVIFAAWSTVFCK